MNKISILIYLVVLIILSSIMFFFIAHSQSFSCDIGEVKIAGDYNVVPESFFNNRYCAIQDCENFNRYQKQINSSELCLV
jgi:hypothetical protein